tara:strand:+ start:120 stop:377 length:258 start_codon:yes stop_codon:yes gene_type:complete
MVANSKTPTKRWRWLGLVLLLLFALAMFMGPGPGLRLVNPEPSADSEALRFLGLPVIYAWGLFWYGIQAAVVVTASLTLWKTDDE